MCTSWWDTGIQLILLISRCWTDGQSTTSCGWVVLSMNLQIHLINQIVCIIDNVMSSCIVSPTNLLIDRSTLAIVLSVVLTALGVGVIFLLVLLYITRRNRRVEEEVLAESWNDTEYPRYYSFTPSFFSHLV